MSDCLNPGQKGFVKDVDVLIAPHHGSESANNSAWYTSNNRFCTIISGDPSFKGWRIPRLANYGNRGFSVRLKEPRPIYYSNTQKEGDCFDKNEVWFPILCTWDKEKKLVGYHIKIDSDESRKKIERIKLYEILFDENGNGKYTKHPIEIEEIPDPRARREQLPISAFVGVASFLLGGFCGAALWAFFH